MLLMGVRLVWLMTVCWGGGNHNDRDCHVADVGEGRDASSADCDDGDVFVQIVTLLSIAVMMMTVRTHRPMCSS